MVFDFPTLVAIIVFTSGLAGCLLLFSWLQHQRIFALALWGSAFIIAALATALIVIARDKVPDLWSIVIGNAILAVAEPLRFLRQCFSACARHICSVPSPRIE
jgi:hypothetical protein